MLYSEWRVIQCLGENAQYWEIIVRSIAFPIFFCIPREIIIVYFNVKISNFIIATGYRTKNQNSMT